MKAREEKVDKYLAELAKYLREENAGGLRDLSNRVIEDAALIEDRALVNISLIAYGLSKLVSKPHFTKLKEWLIFKKEVLEHLETEIKKPRTRGLLEKMLMEVVNHVERFDSDAGRYISGVIEKARVKQASRAYALGASLGKAADLTGADKAELLRYIGITKIHEAPHTKTKSVKERYKALKKELER